MECLFVVLVCFVLSCFLFRFCDNNLLGLHFLPFCLALTGTDLSSRTNSWWLRWAGGHAERLCCNDVVSINFNLRELWVEVFAISCCTHSGLNIVATAVRIVHVLILTWHFLVVGGVKRWTTSTNLW